MGNSQISDQIWWTNYVHHLKKLSTIDKKKKRLQQWSRTQNRVQSEPSKDEERLNEFKVVLDEFSILRKLERNQATG